MSVNNENPNESPKEAAQAEETAFPTASEMKARIESETATRGEAYRKAHPQLTKNLINYLATIHEGEAVLVNSRNRREFTYEEVKQCLEGLGYQIQASANGGMVVSGANPYIPFWIRWVPLDTI